MKDKLHRLKTSAFQLAMIFLFVVVVMLPFVQWDAKASSQWASELRQLKIQKMQLSQSLNILNDHRHVAESLSTHADTVDSITLSLIEATKQQALAEQLELTHLTVIKSDNGQTVLAENASQVHALTVKFSLNMERAMHLLPMFDALREVAGWRPIEVRGCSVVKLTDSIENLQATCSVDVYYFPEVDKK